MATQNNSGANTPALQGGNGTGTGTGTGAGTGGTGSGSETPTGSGAVSGANIAQAAQSLSTLVLEKNLLARLAAEGSSSGGGGVGMEMGNDTGSGGGGGGGSGSSGGLVTYTSIEAAPSLHPAHAKPYCDITGLSAPYRDPKTRLRYHNAEVYQFIRSLPQGVAEMHLAARNAQVILK